jgi:hypothetical protein
MYIRQSAVVAATDGCCERIYCHLLQVLLAAHPLLRFRFIAPCPILQANKAKADQYEATIQGFSIKAADNAATIEGWSPKHSKTANNLRKARACIKGLSTKIAATEAALSTKRTGHEVRLLLMAEGSNGPPKLLCCKTCNTYSTGG